MPPDTPDPPKPAGAHRTPRRGGDRGRHEVVDGPPGGAAAPATGGPHPGAGFDGSPASALATDYDALNTAQAYIENGMAETAVFELAFRKRPGRLGFLMAAGLSQAIQYLESLRFTAAEIDWLRRSSLFRAPLLDYLAEFRFTGDVDAVDEGTVFFADEPVIRITAPLPEAQLVESALTNILYFQTMIASKAARCVLAAPGKMLVDFGLCRAQGLEAGPFAARAAYIAGFAGTANMLATARFGVPAHGAMAHAFVQLHADEAESFARFAQSRPGNVVLLIDTFDTEAAARKVVALAPRLASQGISIGAVRIDSGDLATHARAVRGILDAGGLENIQIFANGGLDEDRLRNLADAGAPIDGFGIGRGLTAAHDCPALDCGYMLLEYAGIAPRRRPDGNWPGRKQIYRRYDANGTMTSDLLTRAGRSGRGEALVHPVMRKGRRYAPLPTLEQSRVYAADELRRLPPALREPTPGAAYPVAVSSSLRSLADEADAGAANSAGRV